MAKPGFYNNGLGLGMEEVGVENSRGEGQNGVLFACNERITKCCNEEKQERLVLFLGKRFEVKTMDDPC